MYNSLDPYSISQHLAFYSLYSRTPEGERALEHGWSLLSKDQPFVSDDLNGEFALDKAIRSVIALVNKQPQETIAELNEQELKIVQNLARNLANRKLKGFQAVTEQEVIALPHQEIDLARGLFLAQLGDNQLQKIKNYEALIDLMALQIKARLPEQATAQQKIRLMNDFIFNEMGFRFPPHSTYAKDIDVYTFLPSVLDSRKGVCLGVSILYICLAQRLDLPLEMITPPGHIYVRYRQGDEIINIETTARGIHIDSEEYLGIETISLQKRDVKEVIGLAYFNQASVFWQQEKYPDALAAYQKAYPYLPNDMLLRELTAFSLIVNQREEEGAELLQGLRGYIPEYAINTDSLTEDYLDGKVDGEGIKALLLSVDETRASILKKKEQLIAILTKFPQFRAGWFALASTALQLHRADEALKILEHCHNLDCMDPTAEYYLSELYAQRFDFNKAWSHFHQLEKILEEKQHRPKLLKALKRELALRSPE